MILLNFIILNIILLYFFRIGCPEFTEPIYKVSPELNPASNSLYYPDGAVFPDHPRFL